MSDEFDDEILLDDDDGGSSRPFLLTAGALIGIMLLSLACLAIFNLIGGGGEEVATTEEGTAVSEVDSESAATATAISATNEAIMTANAFVTQTIESITLTAEAPTNTPTNTPEPPTNTPTNTPTTTPTTTPVVEGEEGEGTGETDADSAEEPNSGATSIFDGLNTATPTSSSGAGGSSGGNTSNPATLPETGISLWGGLAAAFGLILLIVVARRARAD